MDDSVNSSLDGLESEQPWRGCSMEEIHRCLNEFELEHVPPVRPSAEHAVLHHYPIRNADNTPPRPLKSHHKWDALHVRLPCSAKSLYPVTAADGSSSIEPRWEMIEKALLQPMTSSHELQVAILTYNSKYDGRWNFRALHRLFEEDLDESETRVFFEDLLPRIVRLALRLPELVHAPIPLLRQGQSHSITLTQQQIACLLANAFLCTFPRRNTLKQKSEYSTFPDINFNRLFQSSGQCVLEKIKCICHYFRRVCPTERDSSNVPTGVVTFTRRSLHHSDMPKWETCEAPLGVTPMHITSAGTIEDQGLGLLQVDFANKFLGGGVLGSGCVQEEIRFVICPELLISKLFTECLRPTEALLMVGCERYSNYAGYASTFQWAGNHEDATPYDSSRRRLTHIVAIDALSFVQPMHQYREELMLRELNKAYVGFRHLLETPAPGIASGNWGCGAFGGEATLKALLQLMACTVNKRPLVYYTFGNAELRDDVHRMHTFFIEENMRVKDLWAILRKFSKSQRVDANDLYNFIYSSKKKRSLHPEQETPTRTGNTEKKTEADSATEPCCSAVAAATTDAHSERKTPSEVNTSRDLFASSSSPSAFESANENDSKTATPPTSRHLSLSDESETDALLLAAVGDTPASTSKAQCSNRKSNAVAEASNKKSPTAKTAKQPGTPAKELRQRTLLEMLDQCYTDGSQQPASKRHCNANAIAKQ